MTNTVSASQTLSTFLDKPVVAYSLFALAIILILLVTTLVVVAFVQGRDISFANFRIAKASADPKLEKDGGVLPDVRYTEFLKAALLSDRQITLVSAGADQFLHFLEKLQAPPNPNQRTHVSLYLRRKGNSGNADHQRFLAHMRILHSKAASANIDLDVFAIDWDVFMLSAIILSDRCAINFYMRGQRHTVRVFDNYKLIQRNSTSAAGLLYQLVDRWVDECSPRYTRVSF